MDARRREPGQALVELALVLVTLCSLFVAAFDFGKTMNVYLVTVQATGAAARVASVAGTTTAAVQAAAQNAASDTLAPAALTVLCQAANFDASSGSYTVAGACANTLVADSAFAITVSTTVAPVLPFTGLFFGSSQLNSFPVTYTLLGIVEANS
jgi:Flp pilus assembly protein TadG